MSAEASQATRRRAAVWWTTRRRAGALRAIHGPVFQKARQSDEEGDP